jgi:transcriptional regulator with XRE-family HTH domain
VADGPSSSFPADLASTVVATRTQKRWPRDKLRQVSGLSGRTVRDIEAGTTRRYTPITLAKLDKAFGWPEGHAWNIWRGHDGFAAPTDNADRFVRYDDRLQAHEARLKLLEELLEEQPRWASELIKPARLLQPADRSLIISLMWRLAGERDERSEVGDKLNTW